MLGNPFSDPWVGLISRTAGPLKFRFFLQPAMAIFLGVRGGLQDWREGKPAFFWEFVADPAKRKELLRAGWKSLEKLIILAIVLDGVYQVITLRWIYLLDAVAVALFLAVIPYLLVRGPVNRIATAWSRGHRPAKGQPGRPPTVTKAGAS